MPKALKSALLCLALAACSGPGKKPAPETEPKELADSVVTSEKDGVLVQERVLTQTDEMPPLLVKQLNQYFPGWEIPEFSEKWRAGFKIKNPNLVWIKGDFDKNRQEDFAVQVLLQDSISIIAFLQQPRKDTFTPHLLYRGTLSREGNEPAKSFYHLAFLSSADSVYDGNIKNYHKVPQDAIYLASGKNAKIFYKTGKWKTLEIAVTGL